MKNIDKLHFDLRTFTGFVFIKTSALLHVVLFY